MRTSGRGGSEMLMFIAPAAIVGSIFLWLQGDPAGLRRSVDRTIVHATQTALEWVTSLL